MPKEPAKRGALIVDGDQASLDRPEVLTMLQDLASSLGMDLVKGEIKACPTCEHFACVCQTMKDHKEECLYRLAVCSPVAIECDHGYDVCPECTPCTCKTTP